MEMSQFHYLPLTPGFFSILVGIFGILFLLLQLGALRYAYLSLGISSGAARRLLIGSLIGSYFNIPVAVLPAKQVMAVQGGQYGCMQNVSLRSRRHRIERPAGRQHQFGVVRPGIDAGGIEAHHLRGIGAIAEGPAVAAGDLDLVADPDIA